MSLSVYLAFLYHLGSLDHLPTSFTPSDKVFFSVSVSLFENLSFLFSSSISALKAEHMTLSSKLYQKIEEVKRVNQEVEDSEA